MFPAHSASVFFDRAFVWAKLQNTPPLICISLNKNSIYSYIPRSSKHTDTCNGWTGVFCNRSSVAVLIMTRGVKILGRGALKKNGALGGGPQKFVYFKTNRRGGGGGLGEQKRKLRV